MKPHLEVLAPGAMTTVQDLGRFGGQALGIPVSGALDCDMLRLANALVGNPQQVGCLELRFFGPSFRVRAESVRIALAGTEATIELFGEEKKTIAAHCSVTLVKDQQFRVGTLRDTATAYLSVAGGFDFPGFLGSQSTYLAGAFGGMNGRALEAGDAIPLCLPSAPAGTELSIVAEKQPDLPGAMRVVLGPQADYFSERGLATFLSHRYRISDQISRMGVRLIGEEIEHAAGHDIPSDGVVTGAIQVPGNGLPIILLADRQTTGGYPKIATVISADLPRLAQLRPGDEIEFRAVDIEEAENIRRQSEARLLRMISLIKPACSLQFDRGILMQENLISGVTSGSD